MRRLHGPAYGERAAGGTGQALLEFALVLPLFLTALLGMVDIARAVWANDIVSNAAREAARYASVHGGSKTNPCPVGPPVTTGNNQTVIPPASSSCPYPSPSKEGVREVARNYLVAGGTNVIVEVCYGTNCTGDTDLSDNARGNPVTVRVSSSVPMIIPQLIGLGQINVSATSTMLVNH